MCGQMKDVVNLAFWRKIEEHAIRQRGHPCDLLGSEWAAVYVLKILARIFAASNDLSVLAEGSDLSICHACQHFASHFPQNLFAHTSQHNGCLIEAVCSSANLRVVAALDMGRAIDTLEAFAQFCTAESAIEIAKAAALDGDSQRFGCIIAAKPMDRSGPVPGGGSHETSRLPTCS